MAEAPGTGGVNSAHQASVIIPFFASKSLSLMMFGVPGLKRVLTSIAVLIALGVSVVSCGSSSSSSQPTVSGLKFRALVSNPLLPVGTGSTPVLEIVDASHDVLSASHINLLGTSQQPGLMAVSANLKYTLVFSPAGNTVTAIDNTTEAIALVSNGSTNPPSLPPIGLPGLTESMFVGTDNATAYAAVPSAAVAGQAPGVVVVFSLLTGNITASIPVAGAHYIVPSHDGNHILVFSDNSDSVTVISPILIGTSTDPRTVVCCFDRPVWGIFSSDDATAYVFDCGPECGGTSAGITLLNVGALTTGATIPVAGATMGLLSGSTLYVAGTPPGTACSGGTAATSCGVLNVIDVGSLAVTNASPIVITDGFHNRMQMGANGQLFIGARTCSNINISGGEVRGCLSIVNTANSTVVIPPDTGDVTGIQPITGRTVVYLCQGGNFRIYDTTTDKLLVQTLPIQIVGQSIDVKLID